VVKIDAKHDGVFDDANVIGLLKSTIGMCVDEDPHLEIRKNLWKAVEMLYQLRAENNGARRIAAERKRQIEVEGWTSRHDDEHTDGSMATVAALYATPDLVFRMEKWAAGFQFVDPWPESWNGHYDKRPHPGNGNVVGPNYKLSGPQRIRQLEKAGALIAAEIDRLLRCKD
jgi:hypothetical protein